MLIAKARLINFHLFLSLQNAKEAKKNNIDEKACTKTPEINNNPNKR
ncbi:protein of unknown function [Legionella micdadei]|uniref:Uncharacterized protein n=1 Tax=Legionella micdadei TaxID=451 RepID=A0A098GFT9_LEGMI|nr:protein of unknown function [Legionella micdadei]